MSSRLLALGTVFALAAAPALATETYEFDQGHTEILFSWDHIGISRQTAEFLGFGGTVTLDRESVANSVVDVTIDPATVHTGYGTFDEHLVSSDWFDVETHPEIRFVSTGVRQVSGDQALIDGELTIKGITRPVTLNASLNFDGEHPLSGLNENYAGAYYVGFSGTTTVLRSEFDLGAFAPMVSDTVEITINTEMRRVEAES